MSKVKEETGRLVSSLMVHPETRTLLFLRLHNLEDGVEIYNQGKRYKATSEEMQMHFLHPSLEEHQLGTFYFPVFIFSTEVCSYPGCWLAAAQPCKFLKPEPSLARLAGGTRLSVRQPRISLL